MKQIESACASRGIELTPLRLDILHLFCKLAKPVTAYELLRELRNTRKTAEPPTVYRVLDFLAQENIVHKIEANNTYLLCIHPDAKHQNQILICNNCGSATEIEDKKICQTIKASAKTHGFHISDELLEIRGYCQGCYQQQN